MFSLISNVFCYYIFCLKTTFCQRQLMINDVERHSLISKKALSKFVRPADKYRQGRGFLPDVNSPCFKEPFAGGSRSSMILKGIPWFPRSCFIVTLIHVSFWALSKFVQDNQQISTVKDKNLYLVLSHLVWNCVLVKSWEKFTVPGGFICLQTTEVDTYFRQARQCCAELNKYRSDSRSTQINFGFRQAILI